MHTVVTVPSSKTLTIPSVGLSAPPRLPSLSQPVDTNLFSDPARSLDISLHQNTSLHHYDQDVVRELSLPPDSVSPSATTRSQHPQSNGFPTHRQPEGPPSSYLTSPFSTNVSLDTYKFGPRTPSVPATQPSFFAQHGLPASLPPPPRTTFCTNNSIPHPDPIPEPDNIASYLDSLLRGSYSKMLSKKTDTTVQSGSAPELPRGAELELSLDDMLRADFFEPCNPSFEEYLTSPLLPDESPEETPFLETPGEDVWTSPMVDAADDSFGYGEMPLFGAAVKRHQDEEPTDVKPVPESIDMLGLLRLCTPHEHTASPTFDSSKIDSVTPAMDPLDSAVMYTIPQTPALAPASLYNSPRLPSKLALAPSSSPAALDTDAISTQSRPTKPIPTGTRRNITPASLVPIHAPTQPRNYVTPSATSRKALPTAFTKGKKRARSEVDGAVDDADDLNEDGSLDPNTQEAIEAKRRQNTLAARRSRQRKLEHVRELEESVQRITEDRDMWMARAYDAEAKLRAHGLT